MRRTLLLAAVALAAAPASCGGEETGREPAGPIPIESLQSEFEVADCEAKVRCTWMPDMDTCRAIDTADYELLQLIADTAKEKVEYDPAAARKWVEELRGQPCNSMRSTIQALSDAYAAVFRGTVALGDLCLVDQHCAEDALCDRADCQDDEACCAGECVTRPVPIAIGGDCTMGTCEDSAYCDPTGGEEGTGMPTCVERPANGQPCAVDGSCQDGQLCGNGQCYKLSPEGGPCNPSLSIACLDYNDWCDPVESKCAVLPDVGEPCATGPGCRLSAYCDGGVCQPRPLQGEACVDGGPQCLGDLRCQGDTCVAPPKIELCVGDGNPPSGSGGAGGGG